MSGNEQLKNELKLFVKNADSMMARLNKKLSEGREELGIKTLDDFAINKQINH